MNLTEWDMQFSKLQQEVGQAALETEKKCLSSAVICKLKENILIEEKRLDEEVRRLIHYNKIPYGLSQQEYAVVHWVKELVTKIYSLYLEYAEVVELLRLMKFTQLCSVGKRSKHRFLFDCSPMEILSYQREASKIKNHLQKEVSFLREKKKNLHMHYAMLDTIKMNQEASASSYLSFADRYRRIQTEIFLKKITSFFSRRQQNKSFAFTKHKS